jgi:hypothetical protein
LVENLETSVVTEDIESGTVSLPEESKPGSDEGSVGPVATLLLGNGAEEDTFGSFGSFEIFDICVFLLLLLGGTLKFVDLGDRLVEFGPRLLEELL